MMMYEQSVNTEDFQLPRRRCLTDTQNTYSSNLLTSSQCLYDTVIHWTCTSRAAR